MDAAAISRSLLQETSVEPDLARGTRAYLQRGRAILLERHRAGAGGSEIVSTHTTMMDTLVRHLFEMASQDYMRRYPSLDPRCALIAQGGYGRGELNPHSDIDLLFLHIWKVNDYVEAVAEKLLYALWDAGLQVGHAIRSIPESVRLASSDVKVRTSLLDARYLCGDVSLYSDFEKAMDHQLLKKYEKRFVQETLAEHRLRHERYGGSVYLLEPEIKEGEGGLRDIHTAMWIARVNRKAKDLDGLIHQGVMQEKELSQLKAARDFLWRVRNELHFSSGKHHDQLTFEEQEKVALALGFQGERKLKAVEVFMRSYYLHASQVHRLTSLIVYRLTEPSGALSAKIQAPRKEIRKGICLSGKSLWILDPAILILEPGNLIGVFADAQKHGAEMSQETREMLRQHLHLIDERYCRSAAANLPFFEILKWKERVYETLLEMHRCGVLGAFIPEFGRLLCMVLHDLYHIYTVDQHSLRLVREVERLRAGEFREPLPLLTQLAREVEKIEILYLALLFHDIGKGYGGGHSEIGTEMARQIARRMRLNVDDTAQLEFLVRHHLLMAHVALRRDLEDEKTVTDFARTMENANQLKLLYLLTYADMRSVGPEVWTNWKSDLLLELYVKALEILEGQEKGEFQREDRRSKIGRIKARFRRQLSRHFDAERIQAFLEAMPDRYFLTTPEDQMPSHFELMEQFKDQVLVSDVQHFPERESSEMVICCQDRPGLFACITGVFASLGLDILNARITTRKDGLILDVFRISHAGRAEVVMDPHKWVRVRNVLELVLTGSLDVARLVEESGRPSLFRKRAPKVPTVIQVDNEVSDDFTVIEVYTQDRIGVLFTITYGMHQLGISIHIAKISTNVDQVADVFYVTDEGGRKIEDKEQLANIRQTLYRGLVPETKENASS